MTPDPTGDDGLVTIEDLANLQSMMNGLSAMWNAMLDAAGGVRGRAIEIGFSPEAADQIGLLAFRNVLEASAAKPSP